MTGAAGDGFTLQHGKQTGILNGQSKMPGYKCKGKIQEYLPVNKRCWATKLLSSIKLNE